MGATRICSKISLGLVSLALVSQSRIDGLVAADLSINQYGPDWCKELMGGDLSIEFMQCVAKESAKQQQLYYASRHLGAHFLLDTTPNWKCIGPMGATYAQDVTTLNKVDSGRLNGIIVDPSDTTGNTVYVLAVGGGLWKCTDFLSGTPTWRALSDFVGSTTGGAFALGTNASTIYLGLGDAFDLGVGGYMLISSNGGTDWSTPCFLGSSKQILDVKVDSSQGSDIVLVGTDTGFYRSTDGNTFQAVATDIFSGKKVWNLVKTSAGWLAAAQTTDSANTGSLYLSTDLGASWSAVSTPSGAGRVSLGVGKPGDAIVYAFASSSSDAQLDLFRSSDGGRTWAALGLSSKTPTNANSEASDMNIMKQGPYNQMLLVDPSDAGRNTVYIGGTYVCAKSADGGSSWRLLSSYQGQTGLPYVHCGMHCATFSSVGNRIILGTDGGLFTSTDGGATFDDTKNSGLVTHLVYSMTTNPESPDSVLIGNQWTGIRLRSGSSSIFNQIRGQHGCGVGWSQAKSAAAISSGTFSNLYVSTDANPSDQSKWTTFTNGLTEVGSILNGYLVSPVVSAPATADPTGQTFFHNSRIKIYRTTNAGSANRSWKAIGTAGSNGLPSGTIAKAGSHVVSCSPVDVNHVAVAGPNSKVFITKNGGLQWSSIDLSAQISSWAQNTASISWVSNEILYACSAGTTLVTGSPRIAKSKDGGATWTAAGSDKEGLPLLPVIKVVASPADSTGQTVFAATWLGVYVTTDGGANWTLFGLGLPNARVTDMYLPPDGSYIRVSTWGRGVWETKIAPAEVVSVGISPLSAMVEAGKTFQFTASVTGDANTAVTWTATAGTIDSAGLYSAPAAAGNYTIRATSSADSTKYAECAVSVSVAALAVNVQPADQSVTEGAQASYTVSVAGGTAPYTYQWYKNGTAISAATEATCTFTTVLADNSSKIYVIATDNTGKTATSNTASLTVQGAPKVAVSVTPSTATVNPSVNVQFTSSVSGSTNTAVTWSASSGTVNSSGLYTAPSTPGTYTVRATSVANTSIYTESTVTVSVPSTVSITLSSSAVAVKTNATYQFTASVTGNANTGVNWTATGGSVSATGLYVAPATAGTYTVRATSAADSTKYAECTVSVSAGMVISQQPADLSLTENAQGTLTVAANGGTAPYTYQWFKNGTAVGTAKSASYTFTAATSDSGGKYYVVVQDSANQSVTSNTVTLTVTKAANVVVSVSPATTTVSTQSLTLQGGIQFTAAVTGNTNTAVTWTSSGGSINTSGLFVPPSTAGTYTITATSNADKTKTAQAVVTVNPALGISTQPANQSGTVGNPVTFSVVPSGGVPSYSYKWYRNGSVVTDATSSSYSFTVASNDTNVWVVVQDSAGFSLMSNTATLTITSAEVVTIAMTPKKTTILVQGTAQLSATVNGSTNKSVTWTTTGGTIGANGLYTAPSTAGNYTVTATSAADKTKSAQSVITVNPLLSISSQPASQSVATSGQATFSVAAAGGIPPYTYQWYENNTAITDGTSSSCTIVARPADNGAKIHVVVKDSNGSAITSSKAGLSLNGSIAAWDANISYRAGDQVTYKGTGYTALTTSVNTQPDYCPACGWWKADSDSDSSGSGSSGGTTTNTLSAPTGITMTRVFGNTINITWQASRGATSYKIYDRGIFIGTVPTAGTTLTNLVSGGFYSITIAAVNQAGTSAQSRPYTFNFY